MLRYLLLTFCLLTLSACYRLAPGEDDLITRPSTNNQTLRQGNQEPTQQMPISY